MIENNTGAKRPSIRDLQIDRPQSDVMKKRRLPAQQKQQRAKRHRRGGKVWWIIAGVLFIAMIFVSLPVVFSDTTIKITPVVTKAVFDNAIFNAVAKSSTSKDSIDSTTESTIGLKYGLVEWSTTDSILLEPTGREQVEKKASGVITVYNNYTTKKQRLIKNTRFETQDGRVYRVRNSIVVPGKTDAGPGQLDVTVYADEAGDKYNLSEGDLTLPGLKSLPDMYSAIYAKVKTPITGGFKGERAVVSKEAKENAITAIKDKMRQEVLSEVESRIPTDARYFDSGVMINFSEPKESEVDGKVQISETADVSVIIFDKKEFASTIAQGVVGNPDKGYPVIKDIATLDVKIEQNNKDNEETIDTIKLTINGSADFIWKFDVDTLKADLAGKQREALKTILKGYPTIENAEAIIRPFWRKKFPSDPKDFTIEILDVE